MWISPDALAAIVAHAREARPRECCGILIGTAERIMYAVPTANLAESPTRFLIDPKGHIEARREAHRRGLDVAGFYHSHPHSEPAPSASDLEEASYPDALYLIVSLAEEVARTRLFRLDGNRFAEVELTVAEE